jgi:integrase
MWPGVIAYSLLFHLAYTDGRRGELLNLRWRDADLGRAEIRISGSAAVIGGTRIEGTTKSGRSRTVSIGPAVSDHRPEASSRPPVKAELTSARLNGPDYQLGLLARCLVQNQSGCSEQSNGTTIW